MYAKLASTVNILPLLLLIVLLEVDVVLYLSDNELIIGFVDVPVTDMFVPAVTDVTATLN